jgi:hypothetical protein
MIYEASGFSKSGAFCSRLNAHQPTLFLIGTSFWCDGPNIDFACSMPLISANNRLFLPLRLEASDRSGQEITSAYCMYSVVEFVFCRRPAESVPPNFGNLQLSGLAYSSFSAVIVEAAKLVYLLMRNIKNKYRLSFDQNEQFIKEMNT